MLSEWNRRRLENIINLFKVYITKDGALWEAFRCNKEGIMWQEEEHRQVSTSTFFPVPSSIIHILNVYSLLCRYRSSASIATHCVLFYIHTYYGFSFLQHSMCICLSVRQENFIYKCMSCLIQIKKVDSYNIPHGWIKWALFARAGRGAITVLLNSKGKSIPRVDSGYEILSYHVA